MVEDDSNDDNRSLVSHKDKEQDRGTQFGITPDQHKALLSLLKSVEKQQYPMANQIATTSMTDPSPSGSGIICTVPSVFKSKQWILDTGATDHICFTLSEF